MKYLLIVSFVCALCVTSALGAETSDKKSLGWIETVRLDRKLGLELQAKLDTGADSSSLDARHIRRVRVGDKSYVRFSIKEPVTGEIIELRKPYLRRIRIKRHGGNYQRRYVVRMTVCIGDKSRSIDVNLIDREYFDYPMLLGRSAMEGWAIVDPSKTRTVEPTCWPNMGGLPQADEVPEAGEAAGAGDSDQPAKTAVNPAGKDKPANSGSESDEGADPANSEGASATDAVDSPGSKDQATASDEPANAEDETAESNVPDDSDDVSDAEADAEAVPNNQTADGDEPATGIDSPEGETVEARLPADSNDVSDAEAEDAAVPDNQTVDGDAPVTGIVSPEAETAEAGVPAESDDVSDAEAEDAPVLQERATEGNGPVDPGVVPASGVDSASIQETTGSDGKAADIVGPEGGIVEGAGLADPDNVATTNSDDTPNPDNQARDSSEQTSSTETPADETNGDTGPDGPDDVSATDTNDTLAVDPIGDGEDQASETSSPDAATAER